MRGLRLAADAWITKPCHPEELIAVVQAAVRRQRRSELPVLEDSDEVGEITIRPDRHQAYIGERSLELTAREFEILYLLYQAERVLRREEIYETLWGYAMARGDRSVDVFVGKMRQKLRTGSPGGRISTPTSAWAIASPRKGRASPSRTATPPIARRTPRPKRFSPNRRIARP